MTSVFSGTLSGSGSSALTGGACVPIDVDIWVKTVPINARYRGAADRRLFQNVGYLVFFNTTYVLAGAPAGEAVAEPVWFNQELQDKFVDVNVPGNQADSVHWWVEPGYEVQVNVSA